MGNKGGGGAVSETSGGREDWEGGVRGVKQGVLG